MERHPFDPISAFFGLVFTAAALGVLFTDEAVFAFEARWFGPLVILALGAILILSGLRRSEDDHQDG